MRKLWLVFLLSGLAFGQGVAVSPNVALQTLNGFTRPIANATITVCAGGSSGIPCSPPLSNAVFANTALTVPLSNPFTADANGNYTFAVASGNYTVTVSAANFSGYSYQLTAPLTSSISNAGVFTNTQCNLYFVSQVGSTTPCAFYESEQGNNNTTDALTGMVTVPSNATVHQANGVDGLCLTNAVSAGSVGNCVGVYGQAVTNVSNSAAWGSNFIVTDKAGISGTTLTGSEIDMNISGAPTAAHPLIITGLLISGGTMPAGPTMGVINSASTAFGVGMLFGQTNAFSFPVTFYSARGASNNAGLMIDAQCYSGACNSQTIQMGANTGSAAATMTMQAFAGTPSGTCATNTLGFNASASTASTMLYVCVGGTSTWTAITIP